MKPVADEALERVAASRVRLAVLGSTAALLLVVGLGLLVAFRSVTPDALDAEWMEEIVEHRSPLWEVPSRVFDFVGGGWFGVVVVPLGIAIAFLVACRPWAASAFLAGSIASSALVQLLKAVFGRARPADILLPLDSPAFPSGHVANAATMVVLLALLLRRVWIAVAGAVYVVLMALSRTYLGAHWLTDTVGGALLGGAMAVLTWVVFARVLRREHARRAPDAGSPRPSDG